MNKEFIVYTREDAGRELPGVGAYLLPGKPVKVGDLGLTADLAEALVERGDCEYVKTRDVEPDPEPEVTAEVAIVSTPDHEAHADSTPAPEAETVYAAE